MRMFFVFSLLTVGLAQADGPVGGRAEDTAPYGRGSVTSRTSIVDRGSVKATEHSAIPAGAVEAGPYLYRYTDGDGKKWFYRETPFGVVRFADEPVTASKDPVPSGIIASDDGEAVRFERLGPFGVYHWRRSKTELDAGEQAAWDRERARLTAKQE